VISSILRKAALRGPSAIADILVTVSKSLVLAAFWTYLGVVKFLVGFVQITLVASEACGEVQTLLQAPVAWSLVVIVTLQIAENKLNSSRL